MPPAKTACPSKPAVAFLLSEAGVCGDFSVSRLSGGANNRAFQVRCGKARFLLKEYFRHPNDTRDRLRAEFGFSRFAWDHGLRCLPRPLAWSPRNRLALYEFIQGRKVAPGEPGRKMIAAATDLYRRLNRHRDSVEARRLPDASEACFSIARHLALIEGRVRGLRDLKPRGAPDREALAFARGPLSTRWKTVCREVLDGAAALGVSPSRELPRTERRLSPSDFGFHNCLVRPDGSVRFIDFEYAGWDDPAKTVCDFFCQTAVQVPGRFFEAFTRGLRPGKGLRDFRVRADLLLPAYRIKWCCIVLNVFGAAGSSRRRFAADSIPEPRRKAVQLAKAKHILEGIEA